jgi:luciferase family oxidoreductase group 1
MTFPLAVLDLAPIPEGSNASEALANSLDLARHAEGWGYSRYWMAEHHNFIGIASAATSVCLAHVAAGTKTIRVGAGGIMLPNHSPLVIAEQFGTLEALHPGRIDLALGRAPGTDRGTVRAMRRSPDGADSFPSDVLELQSYFAKEAESSAPAPEFKVRAVPGNGLEVPLWILGSSTYGAHLAAELGLPYAFASHFAPASLMPALQAYRAGFNPSKQLAKSHAMAGINVVIADTDAEARRLFTSVQQQFTGILRNVRKRIQPPLDSGAAIEDFWSPEEKAHVTQMLRCSFVGSPDTVREGLRRFIGQTGVDELIVATMLHSHPARLRSYELLAEIRTSL